MNKRAILSLILVFSSLTSCRVVIKLVETNYSKTSNFDVIKKDEEGEGYYRLKEYQPLPYGLVIKPSILLGIYILQVSLIITLHQSERLTP